MSAVAKSIPHDSGPGHVSGSARYVDDYPLPENCVHLAFGLSEKAHALYALDLSDVWAAEGVIDVLVAGDLPATNDVSPSAHDEPLLADGTVHYLGQPMFLVVADTHLNARRAARLGKVDYAEKPALVTLDQAIAAECRFGDPLTYAIGDAEAALEAAIESQVDRTAAAASVTDVAATATAEYLDHLAASVAFGT